MLSKTLSSIALVALVALAPCVGAAELVVIVHPGAGPMSKEQVADVFLGKNPGLTPVDLPESSPSRADFYKRATGRDLTQIKSVWSRVVFTGKGLAPRELADAAAVKKAVAADPKVVGYIEKSALDNTVKLALVLD